MEYTALVVDDNFYNRDLARLALETLDYKVTEAVNGVQALELLQSQRFDMLILDLAMPELSGVGVLNQMFKSIYHQPQNIIVITAYGHLTDGVVDAKTDMILYKPIDIQELVKILRQMHAGNK